MKVIYRRKMNKLNRSFNSPNKKKEYNFMETEIAILKKIVRKEENC